MKRILAAIALLAFSVSAAHAARDYINIVGSSTVYPFATVVAEQFGKTTQFKTPKIESTGSGGGFKLFCAGVGVEHPDITNASRAIKTSEIKRCRANGVTNILEVKIGFDGIVLANSKSSEHFRLTTREIFLALAKEIPASVLDSRWKETTVPNPFTTWAEINPALPDIEIRVYGPPPTSGTRDAFVELAMEHGAKQFPMLANLKRADKKAFKRIAHTLREDGHFVEAGENDNLIVQKLEAHPHALGIFGFSYLDQNLDKIQGSIINGSIPTFDNIADGKYPISRPLFFYVKGEHIGYIPGITEYIHEFMSPRTTGRDSYLSDKGLIPLPEGRATMKKLD